MSRDSDGRPQTYRERMIEEVQRRRLENFYDFPIHVLIPLDNTGITEDEKEKFERDRQNLIKAYALQDSDYLGIDRDGEGNPHLELRLIRMIMFYLKLSLVYQRLTQIKESIVFGIMLII